MDKILILDFGSQFAELIARRVREAHVYCELLSFDTPIATVRAYQPQGIILSGGPDSVYQTNEQADAAIFELGIPVLGICYGMQWMTQVLGGHVAASATREFGHAEVVTVAHPLFDGLYDRTLADGSRALTVWMSHADSLSSLPPGFSVIGYNRACPYAAIADERRHFYGVQFHPEVTHTPKGRDILQRFVLDICHLTPSWTMPHYIDERVAQIRSQVGEDKVLLGISGGVDSSVAAALIHRAIGTRLSCVFVDHGLLRLNERQIVKAMLSEHLGLNVTYVDAADEFMSRLKGIHDPEQKRKMIGAAFVEVFQQEAQKSPKIKWLAQGTIYPDRIESAQTHTQKAQTIKSHHNVGGLPDTLRLKLLEPLNDLFKDEVRELGVALGLSHELITRHPFPGPGLGVRILGEVKTEYADILRAADAIFIEELHLQHDATDGRSWYDKTSQAFAVFLPLKTVGVMGDGRSYEYVIALRAVTTTDFMSAQWAPLPPTLLARVSNRIINEVPGVNRVVYDISSKPPATIEWE